MTTKPMAIQMVDTVGQLAHIREEVDAAVKAVVELVGNAFDDGRIPFSEWIHGTNAVGKLDVAQVERIVEIEDFLG